MSLLSRRQFLGTATIGSLALPQLIPARLLGADAPSKKITIGFIGVGDHVELWDAQRWQQYLKVNPFAMPIVIQEEEECHQKGRPASAPAPFNF